MARWPIAIQLTPRTDAPLFRQIGAAIVADIRRGRLRPGSRLPGTRTIGRALGVNRQTVVVAIDELLAEGWLEAIPARGTFVSKRLPDSAASRSTRRTTRPPFAVPEPPPGAMPYNVPAGGLLLAPNRPDVRLLPHTLIGRAYGRAIRESGQHLLGYGRPQGHEPLRAAIASMLSATRGLAVSADDLCLTRGSQMAIALLARTLVRSGDLVVVEELCHQPAVEAFRVHGAQIATVPLNRDGVDVDAVERLARSGRVRALYLTPHHQFPTTVTLSAPRRLQLLALAKAHRFAIVEEDYDHEFHFEGRPVLPLASLDTAAVVAYVGTFSKVLAPGLRIGYIAAPPALVAAAAAHRLHLDVQGDRVLEHALATLIEGGGVQRHVRRVHREYAARRDVFIDALRRTLGGALTFTVPGGGIAIWARAAEDLDVDVWAARAYRRGVVIETARHYAVDRRPRPFTRLGFASLNRRELVEAVRRLGEARPSIRKSRMDR
jgi:GntR family transcriptional regulator/MocR family aminotransferase